MTYLKKTLFIIAGLTLFLGSLNVSTTSAQELDSIRLQPALIEQPVEPGESLVASVDATNLSSASKTFYILIRDIKGLAEDGKPIFADVGESTGFEISDWISVPSDQISLATGQTKKVQFTVSVPQNATPGSHFGALFISANPVLPKDTGIGIGYQVGSIVSLRVKGDVVEEGSIREFRTDNMIYGTPNVNFITKVQNRGNAVLRPRGPIEITNILGKKVATITMNDSGGAVLPKTDRTYQVNWNYDGLAFGRYEAVMGLVYGDDARSTISASTTFWVLPAKAILWIAGLTLLLLLLVSFIIKVIVRRKLKQLGVQSSGVKRKAPGYVGTMQDLSLKRLVAASAILVIFILVLLALLFFMFA